MIYVNNSSLCYLKSLQIAYVLCELKASETKVLRTVVDYLIILNLFFVILIRNFHHYVALL